MVSWCNDCQRYINQVCDRCGEGFGSNTCEKYACGGMMICPVCKGNRLSAKKAFGPDPYDYIQRKRDAGSSPMNVKLCPGCNAKVDSIEWRYCVWCGQALKR